MGGMLARAPGQKPIYEQVSVKSEVGLEAGFFQPSIRCHRKDAPSIRCHRKDAPSIRCHRKDAPHNVIRSGLIQGNGVPKAPWANNEVRLLSPASNLTASSHNGLGPLLTTGLGPTGGGVPAALPGPSRRNAQRRVHGPGTLRPPPARPRPSAAATPQARPPPGGPTELVERSAMVPAPAGAEEPRDDCAWTYWRRREIPSPLRGEAGKEDAIHGLRVGRLGRRAASPVATFLGPSGALRGRTVLGPLRGP